MDQWKSENPLRKEAINRRCQAADEVAARVWQVAKRGGHHGQSGLIQEWNLTSTMSIRSTISKTIYPELPANGALALIAVACSLLDRRVKRSAKQF